MFKELSACAAAILVTTSAATAQAAPRAAAVESKPGVAPDPAAGNQESSIFTLGTLYGVATPLYKPEHFRVSEGRLERIRSATWDDYVLPAVYVLPSLAIWTDTTGKVGKTLAVILPAGVTGQSFGEAQLSVGAGFSYGWSPPQKGFEFGLCLAMVWNQAPFLDDEQRDSVNAMIPMGVSDQIQTRLRPAISLGIYLAPTL